MGIKYELYQQTRTKFQESKEFDDYKQKVKKAPVHLEQTLVSYDKSIKNPQKKVNLLFGLMKNIKTTEKEKNGLEKTKVKNPKTPKDIQINQNAIFNIQTLSSEINKNHTEIKTLGFNQETKDEFQKLLDSKKTIDDAVKKQANDKMVVDLESSKKKLEAKIEKDEANKKEIEKKEKLLLLSWTLLIFLGLGYTAIIILQVFERDSIIFLIGSILITAFNFGLGIFLLFKWIQLKWPKSDLLKFLHLKEAESNGEEVVEENSEVVEENDDPRSTFFTKPGLVRVFLILLILIAIANTLLIISTSPLKIQKLDSGIENVPVYLIISLNAVLIYYNIKPEDVLPVELVHTEDIEAPTLENLIQNFPKLNNTIKGFETKIDGVFDTFKAYSDALRKSVNSIFGNLIDYLDINNASSLRLEYVNDFLRKIQETILDEFKKKIDDISKIIDGVDSLKGPDKTVSGLEAIGAIMLSVGLGLILVFLPIQDNQAIFIFLASALSVLIGYVAGSVNRKLAFGTDGENKLKKFTEDFLPVATEIKVTFEKISGDLIDETDAKITKIRNDIVANTNAFSNKIVNEIQVEIGKLQKDILGEITEVEDLICGFKATFNNNMGSYRRKNLLASFNQDYTALLSIIVVSILFVVFPWPAPELLYGILNWVVLFYFASKK